MNPRLVEHHGVERPFFTWLFWLIMGSLYLGIVLSDTAHHPTRRVLLALPFCALGYAYTVAPKRLKIKRYTLPILKKDSVPIRIAFLSDIHLGPHQSRARLERIAQRTNAEHPDMICIGGDMVERESNVIKDLQALSSLSAPLGIFAILGNHDYEDRPFIVSEAMKTLGWIDAVNATFLITKASTTIELAGTDDPFFGHPDVQMLRSPHGVPRVILAHSPDTMLDLRAGDADLVLAGHTHGGQVRLPFVGPLMPIPQRGPQSWDRGLKRIHDIPLIISSGLGCSGIRLRFFCPPELVIVELV